MRSVKCFEFPIIGKLSPQLQRTIEAFLFTQICFTPRLGRTARFSICGHIIGEPSSHIPGPMVNIAVARHLIGTFTLGSVVWSMLDCWSWPVYLDLGASITVAIEANSGSNKQIFLWSGEYDTSLCRRHRMKVLAWRYNSSAWGPAAVT